ncbi:hypothetical protein K466DRAFT_120209 [Polyporus arcularius HHB13444]|uniref:Secreted protein n=1 Tax=Polyporus arcularius HHB13444 TaxID=1314778 RepID=A0A5C3Q903_9APHY|nr:hypothetical protein K466DRAFT_120209 [Polyporus arcularius HHB13444]
MPFWRFQSVRAALTVHVIIACGTTCDKSAAICGYRTHCSKGAWPLSQTDEWCHQTLEPCCTCVVRLMTQDTPPSAQGFRSTAAGSRDHQAFDIPREFEAAKRESEERLARVPSSKPYRRRGPGMPAYVAIQSVEMAQYCLVG